jgi:hypothetical protein
VFSAIDERIYLLLEIYFGHDLIISEPTFGATDQERTLINTNRINKR